MEGEEEGEEEEEEEEGENLSYTERDINNPTT